MCNGVLVESKVYSCTWQNLRLFYFIICHNYFQLQSYSEDTRPAVISNYESSFGECVGGTTWVQTCLDRPNFCNIIICWHTISFEENSILWKNFMSVKIFEMKIGILILNSDFMREICYSGKYGIWNFPIFNFENNRCFRLKKNMTIITAIHGVKYIGNSVGSKNTMKLFPVP